MGQRPYFSQHMHMPPQVAEPVPEDIAGVVVIPCRWCTHLLSLLEDLHKTVRYGEWEILVVWYSSEWDDEALLRENMAQFWAVEKYKKAHPGLRCFGINFQHLPEHRADQLAIKLGLDEAAYRLDTVNQNDAPIVLWPAHFGMGEGVLAATEIFFQDRQHQVGWYNVESPAATKAYYLYELSQRYWQQAIKKAGFSYQWPFDRQLFAIRQSAYLLSAGVAGTSPSELYTLQWSYQLRQQAHFIPSVTAYGVLDWSPAANADVDQWLGLSFFTDLQRFHFLWQRLPQVDDLTSFNQWLRDMPQPFVGYLSEHRFPVHWVALRHQSSTQQGLHREVQQWWSPIRLQEMVEQVAPVYYRYQQPAEAVAQLLEWATHRPSDNWALHYQLERLRQMWAASAMVGA